MNREMEQSVLDLLTAHQQFSLETFGPHPRLVGVHQHLSKELQELISDPNDLSEWADCLLLAFDGAMRAGAKPKELLEFMALDDMPSCVMFYRGSWSDIRRDVGYMKALNHLKIWQAWAMIASKFLVVATRQGLAIDEVFQAAKDKLEINKRRSWPDWRNVPSDTAIEHVE